jgi:hypothetical protein
LQFLPKTSIGNLLNFGFFSLCSIVGACQSRTFNRVPVGSNPETIGPTELKVAVDDLASKAILTTSMDIVKKQKPTTGSDLQNICKVVVPKLAFDGKLGEPNLPTLGHFALLSFLSYESLPDVESIAAELGYSKVVPFEDRSTSTTGFVFVHKDFLTVAFAGTEDMVDWKTDLDLVHKRTLFSLGVHKGFLRAYMGEGKSAVGVRQSVLDAVTKEGYPAKKVFVTGHSLGAGLSTLFSMNLAVREESVDIGVDVPATCDGLKGLSQNVAGVVNFASSRVGGHEFSQCYNKLLGEKTWRVIYDKDFLPYMPDRKFYKHVGKRVFITKDAKSIETPVGEDQEETITGFFEYMGLLLKGGIMGNVNDHMDYYIKIANALEPMCPSKRQPKK